MDLRRYKIAYLIIITGLLLFSNSIILSQQTTVRNHYFIQEYLINPAFTGAKEYNPFYISYRRQWAGFEGSPEFFSASGYYILNNESNVAGSIYNLSQGGSFNQTVGQFNYSHDYHFSSWAHITLGAGIVMNQFTADFSSINNQSDPINGSLDPVLQAGNTGKLAFDGALGIKYFMKRFKFGVSVSNLLESKVSSSSESSSLYNKLNRELNLITQYDFTIDSLLHIEPLIVYRYLPESKLSQLDFSVLANYNNSYTLGATYRTNAALSLVAGLQYKKFYFLYSHEISVSGLSGLVGNNNEITVGYRFKLHPDKIYVDNDMDGIINKKDSCPDKFGHKRYKGCPIEEYALLVANELDSITDSLVIDDSLIFKLQMLNDTEMDLVKLYLIDDDGEVVYQAIKTENGFLFKYLPTDDHYYFRLDNLPDSLHFEAMEINVSFGDDQEAILAKSINASNYYEYTLLDEHPNRGPRLLVINDEDQVIAVGIDNGGVFKFDYLPEEGDYNYKLVDADSLDLGEDFEIQIDYNSQRADLKLIFSELDGYSGFLPYFMDEEDLDIALAESHLFLVNDEGEVIYKSQNIGNDFVFKYLPEQAKYLFMLDNIPDDLKLLDLEVVIVENGEEFRIKSTLNKETGYYEYIATGSDFEYHRLNSSSVGEQLLLLNDDNEVLAIGYMEDGVFKFDYLPTGENYHYALINSDSSDMGDYLDVIVEFNDQQTNKQLIYNKIKSRYEFSANLLDESELEDLKLSMEMTEENENLVNALEVFSTNDQTSIDKTESRNLDYFFTIQIGAFKTKMNPEVFRKINKVFGDQFNIYFDEKLQMDKYAIGRFKTFDEAFDMNERLLMEGFDDCFVIGVKESKVVPLMEIED